jgi:hypothetical protein
MALNTDYIERKDLLSNASSTGSYSTVKGGTYIWSAEGTFSSATLQLQAKNANGTATDIAGASLSANGFISVLLGANAEVRVSVTGSPTGIYSSLVAVP